MMQALPLAANGETLVPSSTPINTAGDLPMLQEWAYDFENNELLTDENGLPYLVSGNEALKIWLFWAVITERYRWRANSRDYGTEIGRMIGINASQAIKSSELERTIREAIEICQYVKSIDSIDLTLEDGVVVVDIVVKSVYQEGWVELHVKV